MTDNDNRSRYVYVHIVIIIIVIWHRHRHRRRRRRHCRCPRDDAGRPHFLSVSTIGAITCARARFCSMFSKIVLLFADMQKCSARLKIACDAQGKNNNSKYCSIDR